MATWSWVPFQHPGDPTPRRGGASPWSLERAALWAWARAAWRDAPSPWYFITLLFHRRSCTHVNTTSQPIHDKSCVLYGLPCLRALFNHSCYDSMSCLRLYTMTNMFSSLAERLGFKFIFSVDDVCLQILNWPKICNPSQWMCSSIHLKCISLCQVTDTDACNEY